MDQSRRIVQQSANRLTVDRFEPSAGGTLDDHMLCSHHHRIGIVATSDWASIPATEPSHDECCAVYDYVCHGTGLDASL